MNEKDGLRHPFVNGKQIKVPVCTIPVSVYRSSPMRVELRYVCMLHSINIDIWKRKDAIVLVTTAIVPINDPIRSMSSYDSHEQERK